PRLRAPGSGSCTGSWIAGSAITTARPWILRGHKKTPVVKRGEEHRGQGFPAWGVPGVFPLREGEWEDAVRHLNSMTMPLHRSSLKLSLAVRFKRAIGPMSFY